MCFAAKVYCSGLCSCQGCLNNHTHEETVSCIRKRTESRNPLAFAPTVTRACDSGSDFGVRAATFSCIYLFCSLFLIACHLIYRMTLTILLLRLDIKEAAIAGSLLALKNTASAFR